MSVGRRAIDARCLPASVSSRATTPRRDPAVSSQAAPPLRRPPDLTIVSAANDRYRARDLAVLAQMREKATKEGLNVRIVSYNLGGESKCPDGSLPGIWAKYGIEFREFNFAKYPSHVANLHCYAWKPPIIDEVLQESSANTVVMWVDSGATVVMSLRKVIDLTKKNGGFLSDETAKGLARFSHEKQLDYAVQKWGLSDAFATKVKELRAQGEGFLDNNARLGDPFSKYRNCNGAFSAHMRNSRRYDTITKPWVACSLDRACVCPQGSHRGNARQDQSALTLLAVHNDYVCGSDGKTVAAHGLRDIRGVLNANGAGWTARKEAQLFCPSPVAEEG